jgi:hypothetical protein
MCLKQRPQRSEPRGVWGLALHEEGHTKACKVPGRPQEDLRTPKSTTKRALSANPPGKQPLLLTEQYANVSQTKTLGKRATGGLGGLPPRKKVIRRPRKPQEAPRKPYERRNQPQKRVLSANPTGKQPLLFNRAIRQCVSNKGPSEASHGGCEGLAPQEKTGLSKPFLSIDMATL